MAQTECVSQFMQYQSFYVIEIRAARSWQQVAVGTGCEMKSVVSLKGKIAGQRISKEKILAGRAIACTTRKARRKDIGADADINCRCARER